VIVIAAYYLLRSEAPPALGIVEEASAPPRISLVQEAPPLQKIPETAVPRRSLPDEATLTQLRSSAKLNLSAIYTAQMSFKSDYGRFSSDLVFLGWEPTEVPMKYKIGFLSEFRPTKLVVIDGSMEDPSRLDSDEFLGGDGRFTYGKAAESVGLHDFEKFCRIGCTATAKSFEVLVVIPLGESGKVDVWSITHDKKLSQLWDGVTEKALN